MKFNPPPNWPRFPDGWTPPNHWVPDATWPPPPFGWPLWLPEPVPSSRVSLVDSLPSADSPDPASPTSPTRGSSHFGLLLISVIACLVSTIILLWLGKSFELDLIGTVIGSSPLFGIKKLHRILVRYFGKKDQSVLTGYSRSPVLTGIYGGFIYAALLQLGGVVAGYYSGIVGTAEAFAASAATAALLVTIPTLTLIGLWAGIRCGRSAWLAPLIASLLGQTVGILLTTLVIGLGVDAAAVFAPYLNLRSLAEIYGMYLVLTLLFGIPAALLGRKYEPLGRSAWLATQIQKPDNAARV